MFDCAAEYSCSPPYMIPLDPFTPVQSRWIDVSAGGPNSFTWSAITNASWLNISPSHGSISTSNTDTRLELSVDWNQLTPGASYASIILSANSTGQPTESQQIFFIANKTAVPSGFKGMYKKSLLLLRMFTCTFLLLFRFRGRRRICHRGSRTRYTKYSRQRCSVD